MHLVVAFYCSPKKMAQIENLVNNVLSYEVEGQARKGTARPFISRLPLGLHDIRCEKEIASFVLRDIKATCFSKPRLFWKKSFHGDLDMSNSNRAGWYIEWGIWALRKISRLRYWERAPGPSHFERHIPGWSYCWFIGAHPDATDPYGRELL